MEHVLVGHHGGQREHLLKGDQLESGVEVDGSKSMVAFIGVSFRYVSAAECGSALIVAIQYGFRNRWETRFHS
jgi:hypothetical protein